MSQQGDRQASVRAVTGTAWTYEGDWHALFTLAGVAVGTFDERMLAWINLKLSAAYINVNDAMQALATANGATNFSSLGTFTASAGPVTILDLNFPADNPVTAGFTFARSAPATTYANTSGGVLTPFAANAPRLTDLGFLLEGADTNSIFPSQDMGTPQWSNGAGTTLISVNTVETTDPLGGNTADKVTDVAGTGIHYVQWTDFGGVAATPYMQDVFAKQGVTNGQRYLAVETWDGSFGNLGIVDLTNGSVTVASHTFGSPAAPLSFSVEAFADGWYRLSTGATSVGATEVLWISGAPAGASTSYDGSTGLPTYLSTLQTYYLWQADRTVKGHPSSPIPTTSAAVTRVIDDCSKALALPATNDFTITLGVKATGQCGGSTVFDFHDGTDNNKLILTQNTANQFVLSVITGGATAVIATETGTPAKSRSATIVITRTTNTYELKVGGVSQGTSPSLKPVTSNLQLGANRAKTQGANLYIASFKVVDNGPPTGTDLPAVNGASNFFKAFFPNTLAALTQVKAGTGDLISIDIGDSTSFGANDTPYTNARTISPAFQTATALNAMGIPASGDSYIGNGNVDNMTSYKLADSRLAYTGTAWTTDQTATLNIPGGHPVFASANTTDTMAFQTAASANRVRQFYIQAASLGTLAWTSSGGGSGSFSTAGASALASQVLDLGTSGAQLYTIRQSVLGTVFDAGRIFTDTTTRRLVLVNAGASGQSYSDWLAAGQAWSSGAGTTPNYAALGANLVFLNLIINSETNQSGTIAGLQTMITAFKAASTDVIVVNPQRTSNGTSEAAQDSNRDALKALAVANGCAFLDISYSYSSYTLWAAAGFSAGLGAGAGGVHPNSAGYGYIAGLKAGMLQALYNAA